MPDSLQLLRHALAGSDHFIKCVWDFAGDASPVTWQARRKITALECSQCGKQLFGIRLVAVEPRTVSRACHVSRGGSLHKRVECWLVFAVANSTREIGGI